MSSRTPYSALVVKIIEALILPARSELAGPGTATAHRGEARRGAPGRVPFSPPGASTGAAWGVAGAMADKVPTPSLRRRRVGTSGPPLPPVPPRCAVGRPVAPAANADGRHPTTDG